MNRMGPVNISLDADKKLYSYCWLANMATLAGFTTGPRQFHKCWIQIHDGSTNFTGYLAESGAPLVESTSQQICHFGLPWLDEFDERWLARTMHII